MTMEDDLITEEELIKMMLEIETGREELLKISSSMEKTEHLYSPSIVNVSQDLDLKIVRFMDMRRLYCRQRPLT